jgi:hypothetical protein
MNETESERRQREDAYGSNQREPLRERWHGDRDRRQAVDSYTDPEQRDDDNSQYLGYYSRSRHPFRTARGSGDLLLESWVLTGPHTGRGPRGYRRSDEQILEECCRRLEQDGAVDASDIDVTCEDSVVRLKGVVEDRRAKRRAEDCVESVYGVRDVMNELRFERGDEKTEKS